MNAIIITIGNELLNGSVVNTNATFISKSLYEIGIKTEKTLVVPDDFFAINDALNQSKGIIIITGGLGPTNDDITKKCLVDYVKSSLEFHQPTFENIKQLFERRGMDVSELNRQQAFVIKGCKVLLNTLGTAPGMYIEFDNKHIFALQGVPFEMQKMMLDEVIPILTQKSFGKIFHHRIIHTIGIPESHLQQMLMEWEASIPSNVQIAYLPEPGDVKIRVSIEGENLNELTKQCELLISQLNSIIGDAIWGYDNENLVGNIGNMLNRLNSTLSVAESCTGGYLSHIITSISGSSQFFQGGVVSYSNELKMNILGVKNSTLKKYGAVSRETAIEMVEGVNNLTKTNYSIAITGIAGPNGATENKPVGYVWISVSNGKRIEAKQYVFGNDRLVNIKRAAFESLNILRLMLIKEKILL